MADDKQYKYRTINRAFRDLKEVIESEKPNDRSELDRHYAILRTQVSQAFAYYNTFIMNGEDF